VKTVSIFMHFNFPLSTPLRYNLLLTSTGTQEGKYYMYRIYQPLGNRFWQLVESMTQIISLRT